MKISIISVFKQLYEPFLNTSLIKRAQQKDIISIDILSFFDFVKPKERIDAPSFGPGAGMLIKPTVVEKAIDTSEEQYGSAFKIFFSPHGKKLNQQLLKRIAAMAQKKGHLMLIPARYEGMDARVEEKYADEIVSVGDFVLMGGDIPVMLLLEGMLRLIPGVVGKEESVIHDSFSGPFVDYPEYTQPVEWNGMRVPDIVRSGNHGKIEEWRHEKAVQISVQHHFNWMRSWPLSDAQKQSASRFIPPHYIVLMHDDVLVGPDNRVGTSSVMSIDIHDIARSSATYGIEQFFIVTPLKDQQNIVRSFLSFWQEGSGVTYNKKRHQAIERVVLESDLDNVIKHIEKKEGKRPYIIATSACPTRQVPMLAYDQQAAVWHDGRPILLLFGTAQGLSQAVIERSDYLLSPVEGFTKFNHLSVRSAVAIVLDRWLGIHQSSGKKLPERLV